jgi:hypothetical protein
MVFFCLIKYHDSPLVEIRHDVKCAILSRSHEFIKLQFPVQKKREMEKGHREKCKRDEPAGVARDQEEAAEIFRC